VLDVGVMDNQDWLALEETAKRANDTLVEIWDCIDKAKAEQPTTLVRSLSVISPSSAS
jgi:hypothetical protein